MLIAESLKIGYPRDGVVEILLDRPEKRNALNAALVNSLVSALRKADEDAQVTAIVLGASGSVFCAGADLDEVNNSGAEDGVQRALLGYDLYTVVQAIDVPVIAAVEGAAVAGGVGVALGCDLVIAGRGARFALPEAKHGLVPVYVMAALMERVPRHLVLDMALTGRVVEAPEALAVGLVTRLAETGAAQEAALDVAAAISAMPPGVGRRIKRSFLQLEALPRATAHEWARDFSVSMRSSRR